MLERRTARLWVIFRNLLLAILCATPQESNGRKKRKKKREMRREKEISSEKQAKGNIELTCTSLRTRSFPSVIAASVPLTVPVAAPAAVGGAAAIVRCPTFIVRLLFIPHWVSKENPFAFLKGMPTSTFRERLYASSETHQPKRLGRPSPSPVQFLVRKQLASVPNCSRTHHDSYLTHFRIPLRLARLRDFVLRHSFIGVYKEKEKGAQAVTNDNDFSLAFFLF